jgi:hypothetical protein
MEGPAAGKATGKGIEQTLTTRVCSWLGAAAIILALAGVLRADLQQAKEEPNLEKRSKLLLDNAEQALKAAREAYAKGDYAQVKALAAEIGESVELANTSLEETGKNPRKSPKWFKHGEIVTRDLLRRLDSFQQEMNVADRPMLDAVKAKVQQVHDSLLLGVMEGKQK